MTAASEPNYDNIAGDAFVAGWGVPVTPEIQRARWLEDRRHYLTASDAAKALGVSEWGSPIEVYADKTGEPLEFEVTEKMRRGLQLEPTILQIYGEEFAPMRREAPFTLTVSREAPIIAATLDARRVLAHPESGLLGPEGRPLDGRPVDAKNVERDDPKKWGEAGSDKIPLHYAVQLAIQMHVTDTDAADLAVLFGGHDFRVYHLHRNREVEARMIERLVAFHRDHIVARVRPEIDGSDGFKEYLAGQFQTHTDVVRFVHSEELDTAAVLLNEVAERIKADELEKARLQNLFKNEIQSDRGIESKVFRALWPKSKDGVKIDWEAVTKELYAAATTPGAIPPSLPDLIKKHSRDTIGSRSFRFTLK